MPRNPKPRKPSASRSNPITSAGSKSSASQSRAIYFYRPEKQHGELSQWWISNFTCPKTGITYTSCEQYMMHRKAVLFEPGPTTTTPPSSPTSPTLPSIASQILATSHPATLKALGRKVPNFQQEIWETERFGIVVNGNYLKFSQDAGLRDVLLGTGEKELVEASGRDRIWGVGFGVERAEEMRKTGRWGLNLLGKALVEVRDRLRTETEGMVGGGEGEESGGTAEAAVAEGSCA